jgi:hypothetical protein
MQQQILGIIGVGVGFHMVYKTGGYLELMGRNDWAEQKFGPGGTRLFYKLIGVGLCILGIFGITGVLSDFSVGVLSIFFGPRK